MQTFTQAADSLVLAADGAALTYGPGTSSLEGTSWDVTGYNNGKQALVSLAVGTTISLQFADGSMVTNLDEHPFAFAGGGVSSAAVNASWVARTSRDC